LYRLLPNLGRMQGPVFIAVLVFTTAIKTGPWEDVMVRATGKTCSTYNSAITAILLIIIINITSRKDKKPNRPVTIVKRR